MSNNSVADEEIQAFKDYPRGKAWIFAMCVLGSMCAIIAVCYHLKKYGQEKLIFILFPVWLLAISIILNVSKAGRGALRHFAYGSGVIKTNSMEPWRAIAISIVFLIFGVLMYF